MEKTFVLGVGCQKGGTSWLNKYLREQDTAHFGALKEYHVFDALYIKKCGNWYLNARKKRIKGQQERLRIQFIEDIETYFDYFETLLDKEGALFTADITPSYAGLPDYALKKIKEGFEKRNIKVKVVFLMRDPFERVYSYCRKGIRNNRPRDINKKYVEEESLINNYATWGCEFRTQYEKTIVNLEKVFEPEDIFYAFYENLFNDETIRKLDEFIGIPFKPGAYSSVVNQGQSPSTFDKSVYKRIIANHYRNTYHFVFGKFSETYIRSIWDSCNYLD